jgi:hypothetical protein
MRLADEAAIGHDRWPMLLNQLFAAALGHAVLDDGWPLLLAGDFWCALAASWLPPSPWPTAAPRSEGPRFIPGSG